MQATSEQMWVNAAAKVAEELHRGQRDKAGGEYFTGHLSFVEAGRSRSWVTCTMRVKIHLVRWSKS